jgi:hypothetical protein
VLAVLLFDGDLDNLTEDADGAAIHEAKWFRFLGRRERWTLFIYVTTLVPAMIFDDLGPVMSLTGSLGASSLAYIAPGLVYFGLNGEIFLQWTGDYLRRNGYSSIIDQSSANYVDNGEIELPMVGDSSARMEAPADAFHPSSFALKPWWWWPALMPVWIGLASRGSTGTDQFFADIEPEPTPKPTESSYIEVLVNNDDDDETLHPTRGDFCYSVVLIIFGVIAAVAGVGSNVYVQVHGIYDGSNT